MSEDFQNRWASVWVHRVLRVGVLFSVVITICGLCVEAMQSPFSFDVSVFSETENGHTPLLLGVGIFAMLLTPVMRMVVAFVGFIKEKDFLYALLSVVVLLIMLISFFVKI